MENFFNQIASMFNRYTTAQKAVMITLSIGMVSAIIALVVWAKKTVKAADGSFMSFDENAVVLLKKRGGDPLGSRILGSVPASCNNPKVISLSNRVIF